MRTEDHEIQLNALPFTPDHIANLLFAAEYLITEIKNTPKENIMTLGCEGTEAESELTPMPFVDCRTFKLLEKIIYESRCLLDKYDLFIASK